MREYRLLFSILGLFGSDGIELHCTLRAHGFESTTMVGAHKIRHQLLLGGTKG